MYHWTVFSPDWEPPISDVRCCLLWQWCCVFVYRCICVFVYLCICVFLCLCICVFVCLCYWESAGCNFRCQMLVVVQSPSCQIPLQFSSDFVRCNFRPILNFRRQCRLDMVFFAKKCRVGVLGQTQNYTIQRQFWFQLIIKSNDLVRCQTPQCNYPHQHSVFSRSSWSSYSSMGVCHLVSATSWSLSWWCSS